MEGELMTLAELDALCDPKHCRCIPEYKGRGMADPDCAYCEWKDELLRMAATIRRLHAVLAEAAVFARHNLGCPAAIDPDYQCRCHYLAAAAEWQKLLAELEGRS